MTESPLWHDRNLLARDGGRPQFGPLDAQRFAETLARRLGVDPEYVNPALEDPFYYLQKERHLPINVDPVDNHLEDAAERERLRRVFERGLNQPSGFVLPAAAGGGKSGPEWQTGLWMLRGQHLFLMPGDSPVGLRLPLSSLPWVAAVGSPGIDARRPDGQPRPAAARPPVSRQPIPSCNASPIPRRHLETTANRPWASRRRGWCARRFAWSRGTATCTSSCRRSKPSKTTSSW